jgi:hypothetical protein
MSTNLGCPSNKKANELAQNQRVAGLFALGLSSGKTTRTTVERSISEYPEEAQAVIRQWLNTYREAIRNKPKTTSVKRRVVPSWVKR